MRFVIYKLPDATEKPCADAVLDNGKWYIELKNLEDLKRLVDARGDVVIQPRFARTHPTIIIYDDIRE